MAALVCLRCSAVYAVDAEACPQCGSTESRGDWEEPQPVVRSEHGPELDVQAAASPSPVTAAIATKG